MFSKACQYSIRATIFIAQSSVLEKKVRLDVIAEAINSPPAFTAKLLQKLVKADIINSTKGPLGGFFISEQKCRTTTIKQLVEVIDGNSIFHSCPLGLENCSDKKPCPLHNKLMELRKKLHAIFEESFLIDFIKKDANYNFFLKIS